MSEPGSFDRTALLAWLDGIVPTWAALDHAAIPRLLLAPSEAEAAVRLSVTPTADELTASIVVANMPILLRLGLEPGGLELTARGNLQRKTVYRLCRSFSWPGFGVGELFEYYGSPNEEHAWPVRFLRILAMEAGLLRKRRGTLGTTRRARSLLADGAEGRLQAALFETAGWRVRLAYFDRMPLEHWPQAQFGIVLWALSRTLDDWHTPDDLSRSCVLPEAEVTTMPAQWSSWAFEARMLRPLQLFGLVEVHAEQEAQPDGCNRERRRYRKSPLFDRFLSFDLALDTAGP